MKFGRVKSRLAVIAALVLCAEPAILSAQNIQVVRMAVAPAVVESSPLPANAMPLVKSDPEMTDWLDKARSLIQKKEYAEAIKILQALIDKPDAGFVPVQKNARLFLPLRDEALRLLGDIPSAGLERYRRLYDPKARRKLDDAVAAGDVRGIKNVVDQYRHTGVGPEALAALGQWYFDRSRFNQAARTWRQCAAKANDSSRPLWMFKLAVARRLAGDTKTAESLASELQKNFPQARATLAGRERNLSEALKEYLTIPVPRRPAAAVLRHTYPGWGGLPTGRALMPDTHAVLQPFWRYPPVTEKTLANPAEELQIDSAVSGNIKQVELEGGCVLLRVDQQNRRVTFSLPPLLRPVVVGDLVIYRDDDHVVALDAQTGRNDANRGWKSQPLPMTRKLQSNPTRDSRRALVFHPGIAQYTVPALFDRGRYSLTVGGGRVYTLCHFPQPGVWLSRNLGGGSNVELPPMQSSLAALSLRGEGKLDWIVGRATAPAAGGDPFLHECMFLSPPTYVASPNRLGEGQLYTTALHGEAFYLVCLDAADGKLAWKSQIAQTPILQGGGYGASIVWQNLPAAPPAAADERVFVTTNTGVTAAFDAQTGQPLWAYQYGDARVNPNILMTRPGGLMHSGVESTRGGANPILICGEKVIVMPADGSEVQAFSGVDGNLLWKCARNRHLVALGNDRVCLAGRGVTILRVRDGKELWRNGAIECLADPVVTTDGVLLPAKGKLWRVALRDYTVTSKPLLADGLLGNLVSIDGKLIAANAMGLCAYFDYDQTHARLTERMNHAPLEERVELLQQRGELAFNTFRYPDALNDYTAAEESAKSLPDGEHKRFVLTDLRQRRCRTYVALGNREKDADKALSWFAKAQDLARTKQQRAHMRIRTAKLLEWFGRFPEAVEVAQALGEEFPEEQVVDVRVGADVNPREIFSDSDPILPAKAWAHQFIRRILKIHGQDVYAKFDDRARRALQQARQENTPEAYLAIQRRWPVSKHVPDAYFAAAEVYYARAKQTEDAARADENLRQCVDLLQQVVHHRDNSHWPSTLAALTAVYTADGRVVLASQTRMELDDLPPDTPIAFADLQGPLDTILRDLDEGKIKTIQTPKTKTPEKTLPVLNPPLREIFRLDDSTTRLLFDTNGNPLRLGNIVFVQQGDEILLLDTSAAGAENAVRAAALTKIRYSRGQNFYVGISRHGNIVAVANNQRVSVFQTDTCKLLRQEDWSHYGFRDVMSVGVGDDRIVVLDAHSRMKVIDIATGEVRWKYPPKEPRRGKLPPAMPIEVRAPEAQRGNGRAPNIRVSLIPQIADGLIMAPMYTGDGVYGVFDINSGKLLLSHIAIPRNELQRFSGHIQGQLLGDDRLVIAVNGKLTLYDLKNAKKPVLETTVHTSRDVNGNLLGWNRDFLAVRGPKNNVLVYSLRDPTRNPTALSLSLPKIKGELVPQTAILDEQRVYVFVSRDIAIQALPDRIRFKGLAVTAFDLSSGKQLWSRIPLSMEAYSKLNHTETRRYLVLDLWPSDIQGQCLLIEKATGRIAQRLAITENHYDGKVWHFHRRAVVTNGRLVVENLKGIAVYGQ